MNWNKDIKSILLRLLIAIFVGPIFFLIGLLLSILIFILINIGFIFGILLYPFTKNINLINVNGESII